MHVRKLRRRSHPTRRSLRHTLSAPAAEPGVLHVDLKELVLSIGGYRYAVIAIDEYTRYVFVEFIKLKSEVDEAIKRIEATFNSTVYTPIGEDGRVLPRPKIREIHSDHEGKLMSHSFKAFCSERGINHTTSPPNDHDLNPIAERVIGVISETATAIRLATEASPKLWPYLIAYVVDWHNATIGSAGSSSTDVNISPSQRFTMKPPRVMDLASFGCRAVVLKPPPHQHKPSLSSRGWQGHFLGRSRKSKGCYDVLVGTSIVSSSSVVVDEERFDWAPEGKQYQPLTSVSHAEPPVPHRPLQPDGAPPGSELRFLSLFSGPYARERGLKPKLHGRGWHHVEQIDNDGERGGGWSHDLLNDATYSDLLKRATAGEYRAIMIAFPCSTFTVSRLFDASGDGGDSGPPPVRDALHPDGLPESEIDPRYVKELRSANKLLSRTIAIAIAARKSSSRAVIVLENPSDRSDESSTAYASELSDHGSIFATKAFKRLLDEADVTCMATFAYCRLGREYQKYTTLAYTPEAASILDTLNLPLYQCNHEPGSHKRRVGGRNADGSFASAAAAAYPEELIEIIARAVTFACSGADRVGPPAPHADRRPPEVPTEHASPSPPPEGPSEVDWHGPPSRSIPETSPPTPARGTSFAGGAPPSAAQLRTRSQAPASPQPRASPIAFPDLGSRALPPSLRTSLDGRGWAPGAAATGADGRPKRDTSQRRAGFSYAPPGRGHPPPLEPVAEDYSPGGTADGYSPFPSSASDAMEATVADMAFLAAEEPPDAADGDLIIPLSEWRPLDGPPISASVRNRHRRLPGGARAMEVFLAIDDAADLSDISSALEAALRADSPDAPSTHSEAMAKGEVWVQAESTEIDNHRRNETWKAIPRSEVPKGRRIHKLIWVYKVKRDGSAKARLCVQGTTLEAGIDFDQVFSAALRYSSARALFAYAARHGCRVRSVDLVAAYLQGRFVNGEVVYCHMPVGHPKLDKHGQPMIAEVQKPIYGIQQAGRRLQRMLFDWLKEQGFKQLDDSDPCVFTLELDGEIVTLGCYVDNLQIVHSVDVDSNGRGPTGCAYNTFMDALSRDWDVVDEGPMEDLLGIEIDYLEDGSIKLHQTRYVEKIVERFLPDGPTPKSQRGSVPYSKDFLQNINDALSSDELRAPELVRQFQERVGCLMYAATSTRPDIAFAVHQLCKCLQKPTEALFAECAHVFSYLHRHASSGLTYSADQLRMTGFADASWEEAHSTSGWVVLWQSAALTWGSRKQKSIALSTCEAEIIALSEAAKDVVYLRKLLAGIGDAEPGPTQLYTDSKSARDVSYNPEHHDRMKHVARRHFFVRDMVETFELEVPYVRTDDNIADFFTKPLAGKKFHEMRCRIMNERYVPPHASGVKRPFGTPSGATSVRGGASVSAG